MIDRQKIIDSVKQEMSIWQGKLDELKIQARLGRAELRDAVQPEVERIEKELGTLGKRIKELQEASGDALEEIKTGLGSAFDAIRQSIEKASERFKK